MSRREGVKSEEIGAGRVMRTHTACQKPEKKSQCVADACKYYEAREKISVKEQEKIKGTLNEDEEGKGEDNTYPLPKKTG